METQQEVSKTTTETMVFSYQVNLQTCAVHIDAHTDTQVYIQTNARRQDRSPPDQLKHAFGSERQ